MDISNADILETNNNHQEHLFQTIKAISDCKSLSIPHDEESKQCNKTRKKNAPKSKNGIRTDCLLTCSQKTLSAGDFKSTKTHYKWRKSSTADPSCKCKDSRSNTALYKSSILPVDTTVPPTILGNKAGCENSLHAVQSEAHEKQESEESEVHEEIPEIIEDVDFKPIRTNSLLERLQDSKSNRMLQSINPTHNLDTSPRFQIANPETDALSAPTKANGNSIRRSSRTVFQGKMEVLQETDSEDEKDNIREKRKSVSVKKSSSIKSDLHTNVTDNQERPSRLHSGVDASVNRKSVEEEVLDLTEKAQRCNEDVASTDQRNQAKESPRYLTAVCHNHSSQKSAEKLEAVLYCRICGQAVCYKCAFERHKDHDVTPLGSAAEMIRTKMSEQKRAIENNISQMRGKRKSMESASEDIRKRIKAQFEEVMETLHKKEEEVMKSLEKAKQEKLGALYRMQTQQETAWGQIDAVLKTTDEIKMLEEFSSLNMMDLEYGTPTSFLSSVTVNSSVSVNLNPVQEEIEKTILQCDDDTGSAVAASGEVANGEASRKCSKRLSFKLDPTAAAAALRISSNHTTVEYVGSARNGVVQHQPQIHPQASSVSQSYPYSGTGTNGCLRNRRTQFATVLGDTSITQGKQYWEVSVNRSMEYRLGVAYKHIQGTKTLADDHNSWVMCLTYPDRFAAMHKGRKEYIFRANHPSSSTAKVMRIGLYLDFERGILSFYNASNSAEKRHLYTFRTFFNRPVWPLISLRQGKLQILTGLPVPRNLVWKSR